MKRITTDHRGAITGTLKTMGTLAALTLALFLPPPPAAAQEEREEQKQMRVLLDWFVNPDHAPLIVARQKGFFADEGLQVELIEPADPNDPPKLVAAGEADIGISYQPQLHLHVDRGLPLRSIATLVATPLNSLVVPADGPVREIADLRGRKVGYSLAGFEDVLLATLLEHHGLSLDDVETVDIHFAIVPALLSGQVDAVIGAFRNFEPTKLRLEGSEARVFHLEEEGIPPYDELIVIAHAQRANGEDMRAFTRALERGVIHLVNHPRESWELFLSHSPDLDDELNRRAWQDTLPRFALRPRAVDLRRYEEFAAFLAERGLITEARPAREYLALPQ